MTKELFPACAGVIPTQFITTGGRSAFPRVCGGDPFYEMQALIFTGFSPRVRG